MSKYDKQREDNKDKRLVLLGTAKTCFETDWELDNCEYWAAGSAFGAAHSEIKKIDVGFEIHDINLIYGIAQERNVDYNKFDCPVFVQNKDNPVTKQLMNKPSDFPLDDILEYIKEINGSKFFTSTFCYMIVYAAMLGYKNIALHKILLTNDGEYFLERPGVEYWIDFLGHKEGITFTFPEDAEMWAGSVLYGFEERPNIWKIQSRRKNIWEEFIKGFYNIESYTGSINKVQGMIEMYYALQKMKDNKDMEDRIKESKLNIQKDLVKLNNTRDKFMQACGALQSESFSELRGY